MQRKHHYHFILLQDAQRVKHSFKGSFIETSNGRTKDVSPIGINAKFVLDSFILFLNSVCFGDLNLLNINVRMSQRKDTLYKAGEN